MALSIYGESIKNSSSTNPDIITQQYPPYNAYYDAWKLHDGNYASQWIANQKTDATCWWKIELRRPLEFVEVDWFTTATSATKAPNRFKLSGSNDDINWTELVDTGIFSWVGGRTYAVGLTTTGMFKYYKLDSFSAYNGYRYLNEMNFWYEERLWFFSDVSNEEVWGSNYFVDISPHPQMEHFQDICRDYSVIETTEFLDIAEDLILRPTLFRDQSVDMILIVQPFEDRSPDHKGIITYFVDRSVNINTFNIIKFYDVSHNVPNEVESPQTYSGTIIRRIP